MAKAKEEEPATTGSEDLVVVVTGLKTQVEQLTKVVQAALERLEAVEKQPIDQLIDRIEAIEKQPASSSVVQIDTKTDSTLDRAALIAGLIASGSSVNGLVKGAHEHTIALSAIRVAATLEQVAGIVQKHPKLLKGRIDPAYDELEKILKEEDCPAEETPAQG